MACEEIMAFEDDGFTVLSDVFSPAQCDDLVQYIANSTSGKPGSRALLELPAVADAAKSLHRQIANRGLMSEQHQPIQCTLFAKGGNANWSVTPHQDLSIPLTERHDLPGWSGWSMKENTWFAQPPVSTLSELVAVRLQLDDHSSETGSLEVVPGSHAQGRLASASVSQYAEHRVRCIVPAAAFSSCAHCSSIPQASRARLCRGGCSIFCTHRSCRAAFHNFRPECRT